MTEHRKVSINNGFSKTITMNSGSARDIPRAPKLRSVNEVYVFLKHVEQSLSELPALPDKKNKELIELKRNISFINIEPLHVQYKRENPSVRSWDSESDDYSDVLYSLKKVATSKSFNVGDVQPLLKQLIGYAESLDEELWNLPEKLKETRTKLTHFNNSKATQINDVFTEVRQTLNELISSETSPLNAGTDIEVFERKLSKSYALMNQLDFSAEVDVERGVLAVYNTHNLSKAQTRILNTLKTLFTGDLHQKNVTTNNNNAAPTKVKKVIDDLDRIENNILTMDASLTSKVENENTELSKRISSMYHSATKIKYLLKEFTGKGSTNRGDYANLSRALGKIKKNRVRNTELMEDLARVYSSKYPLLTPSLTTRDGIVEINIGFDSEHKDVYESLNSVAWFTASSGKTKEELIDTANEQIPILAKLADTIIAYTRAFDDCRFEHNKQFDTQVSYLKRQKRDVLFEGNDVVIDSNNTKALSRELTKIRKEIKTLLSSGREHHPGMISNIKTLMQNVKGDVFNKILLEPYMQETNWSLDIEMDRLDRVFESISQNTSIGVNEASILRGIDSELLDKNKELHQFGASLEKGANDYQLAI